LWKIGVAWTFDEDLNKFKCFISHANEAFTNTETTFEHTCNSSIACLWSGPQLDVLKNLTSFLESLTIARTMGNEI
jgi:catabolite regulation protein CreA